MYGLSVLVAAPSPGQAASILEKIWLALGTGLFLKFGAGALAVLAIGFFLWWLMVKDEA